MVRLLQYFYSKNESMMEQCKNTILSFVGKTIEIWIEVNILRSIQSAPTVDGPLRVSL